MILSLDTYSENLGITIFKDDKLFYHSSIYKYKPFSDFLVEKLDDIFKELSLDKREIKKVVVNKGPGSYTGLRIGISVAKTIAYVLNIPIYGYSSTSALAYKYRFINTKILVGINGGKREVYTQSFNVNLDSITPISEIQLLKIDRFEEEAKGYNLVITKNLKLNLKNIIEDVEDLSLYGALYSLKENLQEDIFKMEPLYIRGL